MPLEIEVEVLKNPDGKIIGISLVAGAETYSEDFVQRFPRALVKKEATISAEGQRLIFEGPTFMGRMKKFEFEPSPEDFNGLMQTFFTDKKKITVEPAGMLMHGFKLVIKDE
ncbi:MAG: hypothetical protein UX02_C0001G0305 [Candidatus Moranbacteria bacterium GW2011_GWC1_45_18]|nr:MAG: hypothetical protein UT79_C0002G0092 [Candidatus Moranbacteria bacterium GW2011_GWC2_40_12]KKT33757.1 MAG: hypothetical protein UW19_C0005G0003 [Candidatus Moranbacteria bacterium GW2011_GWF2_44_10]KKU00857.1 MAG: hypothetical protein UX02_C0001G0305 [Candidatus Moranbacteria bacterium GW2011_GWC1_45_18]OGI23811.1 MAG: hypothetical protein A2194_02140 [Candidatus Moranbacteria bacterium RIFOXYA1_FULL_44_8]OGI36964.1 MAG: hypothetical protein A2407_04930 [Candidatus Moranbacteria bacteri